MSKPVLLVLSCFLCILLSSCADPEFYSTEIPLDMPTDTFTLTDQSGKPFSIKQARGKVIVAFFGFTYCPDVCPATLSKWAQVKHALKSKKEHVRFVYITVDPERDTPEVLREHLKIYSSDFIGLTGDSDTLQKVYDSYGVFHEKVKISKSATGYLVNHTARFYIFDKTGRWRLTSRNDTTVEEMTHDIKLLVKESVK